MSPIDRHVKALVKLGVYPILDYDQKLNVWILPAYITSGEKEKGVRYPYLEYQVSNGLEGARSSSVDTLTYEHAKREFVLMCEEKKREPNCFGKMYADWAPECNGGKDTVTNKVFSDECTYRVRCGNIVQFHQQQHSLIPLRRKA